MGAIMIAVLTNIIVIIVAVYLLWKLPKWQIQKAREELQPNERVDLEIKARSTLAQILGGLLLLVGFYSTWKSIHIAQEGQITERFTRAVEQLGSSSRSIRIGGIYALARIARDSPDDRWPVMDILAAYVRDNSPWSCDAEHTMCRKRAESVKNEIGEPKAKVDIQAALTVLIKQDWTKSGERTLSLENADLRGADLREGHLQQAILNKSYLGGAEFSGAQLENAHLIYVCIPEYAQFTDSNAKGAQVNGALLVGASGLETGQTGK